MSLVSEQAITQPERATGLDPLIPEAGTNAEAMLAEAEVLVEDIASATEAIEAGQPIVRRSPDEIQATILANIAERNKKAAKSTGF